MIIISFLSSHFLTDLINLFSISFICVFISFHSITHYFCSIHRLKCDLGLKWTAPMHRDPRYTQETLLHLLHRLTVSFLFKVFLCISVRPYLKKLDSFRIFSRRINLKINQIILYENNRQTERVHLCYTYT